MLVLVVVACMSLFPEMSVPIGGFASARMPKETKVLGPKKIERCFEVHKIQRTRCFNLPSDLPSKCDNLRRNRFSNDIYMIYL